MKRIALALHVVEKKIEDKRLQQVDADNNIWVTGNWVIGDETAKQLVGGMVYVHRGQKIPSHKGGLIKSFENLKNGRKRFVFQSFKSAENILTEKAGWGNEKIIIWADPKSFISNIYDEEVYPEGTEYYRIHKGKERSQAVAKEAKQQRLKKKVN